MQLTITLTCTTLDEVEALRDALEIHIGCEETRLEDDRREVTTARKEGRGSKGAEVALKRSEARLAGARRLLAALQGPSASP